jgi:hypothetical protein
VKTWNEQALKKAQIKLLAQDSREETYASGQTVFNSCHLQNEPGEWHLIVSGQCEVFEDEVSQVFKQEAH